MLNKMSSKVVTIAQPGDPTAFVVVMIVLPVLSWAVLGMRCWTRWKIIQIWGWDDAAIVAGVVSTPKQVN